MTADEPEFGFRADLYTFAPESLAQELPQFRIKREVGKGSMGIVFEAERIADGQRLALKVLPPSLTLTERTLARFVREGRLMATIDHPDLCRVYDHGHRGRLHWFAMEFVDGMTLDERLRSGPLPARKAAELGAKLARALQFAHDRGIVHRDVKPGNVMLLRDDAGVKITDFGLARETGTGSMTESGALVGTPMYMAPEQIRGERGAVDNRTDIYGLGATLYQMITAEAPFSGPSTQAVLAQVLDDEPAPPSHLRRDLPKPLEAVVLKAMEKQPAHRYGSAVELAEDLERFLAGERVLARRPGPFGRVYRRARRHPLVAGLLALIVSLSLGAMLLWQTLQRRNVAADLAQAETWLAQASLHRDDRQRPIGAAERVDLLHRAVAAASSALARDSGYGRAWFVRAKAHHRLQDYAAALSDLDRGAEIDGLTPGLLHYRIDTLRQLHSRSARARLPDDLFRLLELDRSDIAWTMVLDYLIDLAREARQADERSELLDLAERVLGLPPAATASPRASLAQALVLELRGRTGDAVAAMRTACDRYRGDPAVQDGAARFFARLGLVDESEAAAAAALALDPSLQPAARPAPVPGAAGEGAEVRPFLDSLTRLLDAVETGEPGKRQPQD